MNAPPDRCANCGASVPDRYCGACGQDGRRRIGGVRHLFSAGLEAITDVDGRLLSTVRALVFEPGRMTREYSERRFQGQLPPVRLYLVAATAYFFVAPNLGGGVIELGGANNARFTFGPLTWNSEFLLLFLIPSWATVVWVAIADRKRYFEEVFVFSVHYHVVFLALMIVLAAVSYALTSVGRPAAGIWVILGGALLPAVYLHKALRGAFGLGAVRAGITSFVLYLTQLIVGQVIFNLMSVGRLAG